MARTSTRNGKGNGKGKAKGRRAHGEGGCFKMADGRWCARLDLGFENGRRARKEGRYKSQARALEALDRWRSNHRAGLPMVDDRLTFERFALNWLENTARTSVRPRTFTRYSELLKLHAIPHLGRRPLAKLSPADLQALYSLKLTKGLSARTVGHLHRCLHKALADALRWGLVPRSVCDAVKPPKVTRKEMQALNPEQARKLLEVVKGHEHEALYVLAVTAGLRQGELFALKWADLDLDAAVVQVRRTVGRVKDQGLVEAEPKSERSRRQVVLTPLAIAALRGHKVRQLEYRLQVGPDWQDLDLVFANAYGRHLENSNVLRQSFRPLLKRAGLPAIRFHDLRHSAATLLLAQGCHPKVVQEMLGHSSIALTLDTYSHMIPSLGAEAAAKMQAILVPLSASR